LFGKVAGAYVYVSIDTHFVAYCSDFIRNRSKVVGKYVLAVMFAGMQVVLVYSSLAEVTPSLSQWGTLRDVGHDVAMNSSNHFTTMKYYVYWKIKFLRPCYNSS